MIQPHGAATINIVGKLLVDVVYSQVFNWTNSTEATRLDIFERFFQRQSVCLALGKNKQTTKQQTQFVCSFRRWLKTEQILTNLVSQYSGQEQTQTPFVLYSVRQKLDFIFGFLLKMFWQASYFKLSWSKKDTP